jgi:5-carboxymethyl-2-hydroxymuconate isomerase
VPIGKALLHVAGYTICNDLASRPIQFAEMQQQIGIVMGKNLPGFAPIGPWVLTCDEVPDPQQLPIGLKVNGELRQQASTKDMLFSVAELVAYWSRLGLETGDILLTGTPAGVAVARPPAERARFFLKHNDVVEAYIEGIGTLTNTISEARRTLENS